MPAPAEENHVWHIFNILNKDKDELREKLAENGIMSEIHCPIPPHLQGGYQAIFAGNYPISVKIHPITLSLPIFICQSEAEIGYVFRKLKELVG